MPPPNRLDPLEALRVVTCKMNPRAPASFATEDAPAGYLAAAIENGGCHKHGGDSREAVRVAARNGYAAPEGLKAGDVCRVLGTLTAAGALDADGFPAREEDIGAAAGEHGSLPGVWRVETGAVLPHGCDRVARVRDSVLIARREVRLENLPAPGEGSTSPLRLRFEAGTFLSGRLRAMLVESGVRSVSVRAPFPVAVGIVGAEIIDSGSGLDPGSPHAHGRRHDLTGPWLEQAIRDLGLETIGLGVLPDSPDAVRDAILHVRGRADVLVLVGGIGDGLTDRTVESLQRFEARVLIDGLDLEGCRDLFFAKTMGIDIVGLGGKPLEAASGFDLFLRPALLARLGARSSSWDWSWTSVRQEAGSSPGDFPEAGLAWRVEPAARVVLTTGEPSLRRLEARDPFVPAVPGQDGWAIVPPRAVPGSPLDPALAYFQPTPGF